MPCNPQPAYQNDTGKELDVVNIVKERHQIVFKDLFSARGSRCLLSCFRRQQEFKEDMSIQYKMKVLPIRTFPTMGMPHKVGATFPVTSLRGNLWVL